MAQNTLEQKSFTFLSDYLDHHKSTDTLYFDYLKAYENKAQQTGDLKKLFYAKSEYIIHGATFEDRLQHAQQLLQIATQKNNLHYMGLAHNKLALVYYMERNLEQSLHYELQAEELLSQTNDLYSLNKARFGIGSMYHFLGDYEKALTFFNKTATYYKNQNSYNDLNGYLSSLGYIGKCYFGLGAYTKVDTILKIGAEQEQYLKKHHQELNNAYFALLKGQNLWAQKQYQASLAYLQKALPVIINNDDFANEHLAYLYIGKNLWDTNQPAQALNHFKKIDTLFTQKQYSDLNLLEAYTYLIAFYKTAHNLSQQLFYTERLLAVTNHLQANNKGLSTILHTKYETHKLEANRQALQKQLKVQKQKEYLLYVLIASIAIGFIGFIVYNRRKQKTLRKQYEYFIQKQALADLNTPPVVVAISEEPQIATESTEEETLDKTEQKPERKLLADQKVQEILKKLTAFEANQGYLNADMKLDVLAKTLDTNAKYLSEVINVHKGQNFANYVNQLRINEVLSLLKEDKQLRELKITALAEAFGFNNARSFSDAFFKVTSLKPSYYISQIEKDDKKSSLK